LGQAAQVDQAEVQQMVLLVRRVAIPTFSLRILDQGLFLLVAAGLVRLGVQRTQVGAEAVAQMPMALLVILAVLVEHRHQSEDRRQVIHLHQQYTLLDM
jgi:hypothetical protein